ncbi:MAG: metallophosphoesterase [Verrucomicrobiota bacterium]
MVETEEKSTHSRAAIEEKGCALISEDLVLDGGLGLYHQKQRWLAVSDLHFGYELSRRVAGGLWPLWGMATVAERLDSLVKKHQPDRLILAGDVVDGAAGHKEATAWLTEVSSLTELILIKGNHDRGRICQNFDFLPYHLEDGYYFHHGHLTACEKAEGRIKIEGHIHPSHRFDDGAGLRLKLPSLLVEDDRLVLPAFSPWAGGVKYDGEQAKQWVCSPQRVWQVV